MRTNTITLKNLGIRQLLIISYILVLLIPSTLQVVLNTHFIATYKKELVRSDSYLLNDYKTTLEYYLRDIINMSSMIYGTQDYIDILKKPKVRPQLEIMKDYQTLNTYFQQVIYRSYVRGVYIYTTNYQHYTANGNFGFIKLEEGLQKGTWISSIMEKEGELFFIPTHEPQQLTDGFPVFSLIRKIKDPRSGEIIALMLIDINPEVFKRTSHNNNIRKDTQFFVTDKNNDIIFHSSDEINMGKLDEIYHQPITGIEIKNFVYTRDNERHLVSYTNSTIADWLVYIESPLNTVEQSAVILRNFILAATGLGLLVAIIIGILFSSLISEPLKKLTGYMKDVEKNNFDTYPTLKNNREIFLLTVGFNTMISRIKYLLQNELQLKLLKKDADFKALQAQINPHFLYNTLETISSMADIKNVPEISKTCLVLSNMFRYSIGTKKDIVPLSYEIQHMMNYIAIMQLRFENHINLQIHIPEDLHQFGLLKLTLQPLVENCIHHGYDEILPEDSLVIKAYEVQGDLCIQIIDSGKGFSLEKLDQIRENLIEMKYENIHQEWNETSHNSIGMGNIHMRYALYYGPQYGIINIENLKPKGSKVTILLPAQKL